MNAVAELTEAQRVVLLGPNDLPRVWEQIKPLVEKACTWSQGQFSPEAVVDGVLDGRYRMLAYMDGEDVVSIAVLTVSEFATGLRILEVWLHPLSDDRPRRAAEDAARLETDCRGA
jgi:hypothetical protein